MKKTILSSLVLAASLGLATGAHAATSIIVKADSPLGELSMQDVEKLFLGKTKSIAGNKLTPIDQADGAGKDAFYELATGKDAAQLKAYWSRLVFTGKGKPPKAVGGDAAVKAAVAADATVIGYIDSSALDGSVKELLRL